AVGVLIARRVAGQPYHEVDAGFGPGDASTQLVKVIYDEKTRAVLAAEAEVSAHPPDEATQRAIRAGGGLVVFRLVPFRGGRAPRVPERWGPGPAAVRAE